MKEEGNLIFWKKKKMSEGIMMNIRVETRNRKAMKCLKEEFDIGV